MKLFVLPGASLMETTPLDDGGLHVRCPGCGHEQEFRGKGHQHFRHGKGCRVLARIEQAIEIYARDEVKRG